MAEVVAETVEAKPSNKSVLRSSVSSRKRLRYRVNISSGGMAEWLKAVVLKTTVPGRVPGVRIPLPPS